MTLSQIATYTALIGFIYIAGFQTLLALGAPLGHLAWGGQHKNKKLPIKLRIASLFSIGIAVLGGITVLESARWTNIIESTKVTEVMLWLFVCLWALSTLGNAMSRSKPERYTGTPVAFLLFASCLILALSIE